MRKLVRKENIKYDEETEECFQELMKHLKRDEQSEDKEDAVDFDQEVDEEQRGN